MPWLRERWATRFCVAEALLSCARSRQRHDAPHLAFGGGDLEERVHALLSGRRTLDQPLPALVCATAVALALGCLALRYVGALHRWKAPVEGLPLRTTEVHADRPMTMYAAADRIHRIGDPYRSSV